MRKIRWHKDSPQAKELYRIQEGDNLVSTWALCRLVPDLVRNTCSNMRDPTQLLSRRCYFVLFFFPRPVEATMQISDERSRK